MKLKIYSELADQSESLPRRFALFPTVCRESHATEINKWIVWLEWYELDARYGKHKWIIK